MARRRRWQPLLRSSVSPGCDRSRKRPRLALAPLYEGRGDRRELRYLDLPRLSFLSLVERDVQHAVLEVRLHRRFVDGRRQREAAEESGVAALVEQEVAGLVGRVLLFGPPLGGDRQRRVF